MGPFSRSSRNALNRRHAEHFTGDTLFDRIARAVCEAECLPRLEGRIAYQERPLEEAPVSPNSLIASVHACGALTDRVLDVALASRNRVAVLLGWPETFPTVN